MEKQIIKTPEITKEILEITKEKFAYMKKHGKLNKGTLSDIYLSPEAMEDLKHWEVWEKENNTLEITKKFIKEESKKECILSQVFKSTSFITDVGCSG